MCVCSNTRMHQLAWESKRLLHPLRLMCPPPPPHPGQSYVFTPVFPVLHSSIWEVCRWLLVLILKDFLLALGRVPTFRSMLLKLHPPPRRNTTATHVHTNTTHHSHFPSLRRRKKASDCCQNSLEFVFVLSVWGGSVLWRVMGFGRACMQFLSSPNSKKFINTVLYK